MARSRLRLLALLPLLLLRLEGDGLMRELKASPDPCAHGAPADARRHCDRSRCGDVVPEAAPTASSSATTKSGSPPPRENGDHGEDGLQNRDHILV